MVSVITASLWLGEPLTLTLVLVIVLVLGGVAIGVTGSSPGPKSTTRAGPPGLRDGPSVKG